MTAIKNWSQLLVLAFALAVSTPSVAQAEQQQWAAAYVDWSFADPAPATAVAQEIWVPRAAQASFFTLNFDFESGQGGYIGLQSDEAGAGNVRFSLWNTTVARGESCRPFDGEGEGMTCVLPVPIDPATVYRVRVTRDATDAGGQWWSSWLEMPDGTQRHIGAIRVRRQDRDIAAASLHNFSEFWGDAVNACGEAPLSAAVFASPILTRAGNHTQAGSNPSGTRPEENRCLTGRERRGAAVTHAPMLLRGAPAMAVALGGAPNINRGLAQSLVTAAPAR
jgi:hypothetical protein